MKKVDSTIYSWVDPMASPVELAVQFDRETQSLRLIQKSVGPRSQGCVVVIVVAVVVWIASVVLFLLTWHLGALVSGMALVPIMFFAIVFACNCQIEVDTKSKKLVRRVRGLFAPWTWILSAPISETACFVVQGLSEFEGPDKYTLSFVPYPDVWYTLWNPIPIAETFDANAGKMALQRLAFGLNRFLDAVRKGESNLERFAQPAPPGPFKP